MSAPSPPRGHLRFIITEVSEYEDVLDCFTRLHQFQKTAGIFYNKGPLIQGSRIGCPRLEHLLNFTLRYSYSLWYDVIFVDHIHDNINVLDLALLAEKILKLNVFLCNLKKAYTMVN